MPQLAYLGASSKTRYCGLAKLKLCVYDARSYLNDGALSIIDALKVLGIDAGSYSIKSAVNANIQGRYNAGYKAKTTSMKRRKIIRGLEKKEGDNIKNQEGVMYEAGDDVNTNMKIYILYFDLCYF